MALPTREETWTNTHVSGVGAGWAEKTWDMWYKIKEALVSSGGWTVERSCGKNGGGSLVAGAGDNWTSGADLAYGVTDYSWIVLKQTGIAANFQLCLNFNANTTNSIEVTVSYNAGFTGGSTSARPTATDEHIISSAWAYFASYSIATCGANVATTASGKCTRIFISYNGAQYPTTSTLLIDLPLNPVALWTTPYCISLHRTNCSNLHETANVSGRLSSKDVEMYVTCECISNNSIINVISTPDYGGEWDIFTAGLSSSITNARGRLAQMRDFWWVPTATANGDYMPSGGSRQFVIIGDLLQPWDGSVLVID